MPEGKDCISPAAHSAFDTPIEMLEFIERLCQLSGGKPVGFKVLRRSPWEWFAICKAMLHTGIPPDFIVVDGAEGGMGAAPVSSPTAWARRCRKGRFGQQHPGEG